MKKKIFSLLLIIILHIFFVYAAKLDPNIPTPYNVTLTEDGYVTWDANKSVSVVYNKFQVRLLKRSVVSSGSTVTYKWTEYGTLKNISGDERSCDITIGAAGVYRVKVRGVNADGNYSEWAESAVDIAITSDNTVINNYGGYNWSGSNVGSPINNNNQGMSVYIGPDGSISYTNSNNNTNTSSNNNSLNIYDKNSFVQAEQSPLNSNQTTEQIGPGVVNNTSKVNNSLNTNTNVNNFASNTTPYSNNMGIANGMSYGNGNGNGYLNSYQGLEVGWHVNNNKRFYYQGNGSFINNSWALIDGKYYRFGADGYALVLTWYYDNTNNSWYYLGLTGEMATGWQFINGVWYYLNPNRGTGYGIMFSNTVVAINGKYYAFSSDGAMIQNAWFNGKFYGADGAQI